MPFTLMDAISLPVSFFLGFPTSLRPDWIRTSNKLFIDLFMSRQLFTAAATDPAPASAPAPDPAAHLSLPAVHRPPLIQQRPHGAHFWGPPPFGIDLFLIFPSQCNFSAISVPFQCHFSAISESHKVSFDFYKRRCTNFDSISEQCYGVLWCTFLTGQFQSSSRATWKSISSWLNQFLNWLSN